MMMVRACGTKTHPSMAELRDGSDQTLGQYVVGQVSNLSIGSLDDWVRYDRNTDVGTLGGDNDCLDSHGSKSYHYHADRNTRVVMLTDTSGDVVERYEYDAYGNAVILGGVGVSPADPEAGNVPATSSVGNPFMHQGRFFDRTIQSYQNRFRQYHSRLGRFMQRDPLGYLAGMNVYEYVGSDPMSSIDPLGLDKHKKPDKKPPTPADIIADYLDGKVTGMITSGVAENVATAVGTAKGGQTIGKAAGKAVSGIFDVIDAATIWQTGTDHVTGPASTFIGMSLRSHLSGGRDEHIDYTADFHRNFVPNEDGLGKTTFYGGKACGWCTYICDYGGDGTASAIIVCSGGESDCSGKAEFDNPRSNVCTSFCNKQKPKPCKKPKGGQGSKKGGAN